VCTGTSTQQDEPYWCVQAQVHMQTAG
jgi:hypothetical protein